MKKSLSAIALGLLSVSLPFSVLAHHPLGSMPMETFNHGLLSGAGHPVLGFDHLFFVLLMGVASVFTANRLLTPLAYIAAMLIGCLITALWTSIPATEFIVALSLLILGGMMLSGREFNAATLIVAFAAFGLFHGSAFGASIAAQESGFGVQVLVGYLMGLGFIQYTLALIGGALCASIWKASSASALQPRLAGAMVTGVGLYLVLEHAEGPLLQLLSS